MAHNSDVHRAVAALAAVAAGVHGQAANPNASYAYRILSAPTSSDERAIKILGIQPQAQRMSDALFAALQNILGGSAPRLNFTTSGDPLTVNDLSATRATNTVNMNPRAVWGLTDPSSPYHNAAVTYTPHEMAHLRQTPEVFGAYPTAEGGAQAFADLVVSQAAQRAGIPFGGGNFDAGYADFVKQAQDRGTDWLLNGQFGQSGHTWP